MSHAPPGHRGTSDGRRSCCQAPRRKAEATEGSPCHPRGAEEYARPKSARNQISIRFAHQVLVQQLSNQPVFLFGGDSRAVPDASLAGFDCIYRFMSQSGISNLLVLMIDDTFGRALYWGMSREL